VSASTSSNGHWTDEVAWFRCSSSGVTVVVVVSSVSIINALSMAGFNQKLEALGSCHYSGGPLPWNTVNKKATTRYCLQSSSVRYISIELQKRGYSSKF